MVKVVNMFHEQLAAISLVHLLGTRKYKAYSWLNDPRASNSTVTDNADAMYRHFIAHSMGRVWDPEGLPHLFHLCCRAGMLVTTWYRMMNPNPKMAYVDCSEMSRKLLLPSGVGQFLTPEEILSLGKVYQFGACYAPRPQEFFYQLYTFNTGPECTNEPDEDYRKKVNLRLYEVIWQVDNLFWGALSLCSSFWQKKPQIPASYFKTNAEEHMAKECCELVTDTVVHDESDYCESQL